MAETEIRRNLYDIYMTESEIRRNLYLLGQIYGYLSKLLPDYNSPNRLQYAYVYPANAVTRIYHECRRTGKLTKQAEDYISERINDVSPEIDEIQPINTTDVYGSFIVGTYHAMRNIKAVIDCTGMTQQAIADKIGVNRNTVRRWYSGESEISEKYRYKIEKLIGNPAEM